jgi:hypothetical protein
MMNKLKTQAPTCRLTLTLFPKLSIKVTVMVVGMISPTATCSMPSTTHDNLLASPDSTHRICFSFYKNSSTSDV